MITKSLKENGCHLIFFSYLIGLIFIPIDPNVSNKIINITGAFSFLLLLIKPRFSYDRNIIVLCLGLFLLGSFYLTWYEVYKTPDVVYRNGYRGYLEAGKMLFLGAFTFLLMSDYRFPKKKVNYVFLAACIGQIILVTRAFYQGIYLDAPRIPLSSMNGNIGQMGAATIAAYMITFNALYTSIVFLRSKIKYHWIIFYLNFLLSFSAIIMTGTRSAIVAYPLMIILMLIIEYRKQKSFMLKIVAAMLFLLLSCGFIFGKEIKGRINAVNYDVSLYVNSNNSLSSVGARLSMIKAGIESAPDGLSWQSLEERGKKIIALSESDNLYKGATLFLNVHMHNEVIEALSTRGILGIIFLAFFYFTLIYYSIRTKKYLLLVFPYQ